MKHILLTTLTFLSISLAAQKPALTKGDYEETPVKTTINKHPNTPVPQDSPELQYFDFEVIAKDKVKITKCHLDWQEVEIPASVVSNGHKFIVVELAENLFRNNYTLQKITIPNTIVRIGEDAFYDCSPHVYFQGDISDWCAIDFADWNSNPISPEKEFYINNCPLDVDLIIPNGTKKIGNHAFIYLEKLRSVTIPNSVTSIGERAFEDCKSLKSVTIPNSVTSIGDWAFLGCSALTSITIPNSVTSIGGWAFYGCESLTSVTIPNSVTEIGKSAFAYCNSISSLIVSKDNPIYDSRNDCNAIIETSTNTLLFGCKNTTIPSSVIHIGCKAFYNCKYISTISIPNSVKTIGISAFEGCSLTSIILNEGLTSIGESAFMHCGSLESIEIPNTVTTMGGGVFHDCKKIKSIKLSNSLKSLPSKQSEYSNVMPTGMFSHCESLNELIIPNGVTDIGDWAFVNCSSLTSLTIPSSVTTVGINTFNSLPALQSVVLYSAPKNMLFFQCPVLTHITWNVKSEVDSQKPFDRIKNQILSFTIGEDVEYIPANICNGMINLESIVIPTNIKQIGSYAFANCNKLTLVTWNATNSKIDDAIFQNTASKIKCFNFGESVNIIPDFLCDGMSNLTSITIPKDVKVIGKNVFRYCRNLTSVIWNAENCEPTMWGEYQNDWYKNKELENNYYIFGSGKQDWYMYGPFANISHKITSFKIGENVSHIPACLCFGMSKAKITFHKDIQTIGEYALSEVYQVQFQGKVTQCANVFYNNKKWYDTIIYIPQEYLKYYKSLRTAMGLKKAKVIYKTF
jgi:hypothetical protein